MIIINLCYVTGIEHHLDQFAVLIFVAARFRTWNYVEFKCRIQGEQKRRRWILQPGRLFSPVERAADAQSNKHLQSALVAATTAKATEDESGKGRNRRHLAAKCKGNFRHAREFDEKLYFNSERFLFSVKAIFYKC